MDSDRDTARAAVALNVRGNVDVIGEMVPRRIFSACSPGRNEWPEKFGKRPAGAGESLLQPDHPLTARVYVNRVWQWVMGAGLVATPDDFGRLGERPTHPELLDYLATEFVRAGWSTKKLIRRLVLTQTFRQVGQRERRRAGRRPRQPAAPPLPDAPPRGRSHPRQPARGVRPARPATLRPAHPPRRARRRTGQAAVRGPLDGNGRRSIYLQCRSWSRRSSWSASTCRTCGSRRASGRHQRAGPGADPAERPVRQRDGPTLGARNW